MHGRDQTLEFRLPEDLQLVQQEEHPRVGLGGKRPDLGEKLTEVLLELAAVSEASLWLPLKAQAHLALGADRGRERFQRPAGSAQCPADRTSPFVGGESGADEPGDDDPEVALATPLVAERLPSRGLGARCELGEEHRLADPARSPWMIRLFSLRPRERRPSRYENRSTSRSRPTRAGGNVPAPGAYGFSSGSTPRESTSILAFSSDSARDVKNLIEGGAKRQLARRSVSDPG